MQYHIIMVKQYTIDELKAITNATCEELTNAQNGKNSSFPYLKQSLPQKFPTLNTPGVQFIELGGTNTTIQVFKNGNVASEIVQTPLLHNKATLLQFLETIVTAETVLLSFAFAIAPVLRNNRPDGKLVQGSKEHVLEGLIDELIGASIEEYMVKTSNKKVAVWLLNDTIWFLHKTMKDHFPCATLIVGTGFNSAIAFSKTEVVNIESANFDKFQQTEEGRMIDTHSAYPGKSIFEKEISGAYLYQHYNEIIKKYNLKAQPITSTKELNEIAHKNGETAQIAQDLFYRSASLIAAHIAGILAFCKKDLTFVAEGSVFFGGYKYQQVVEDMVRQLQDEYQAMISNASNAV